ncbi:hypothetical protein F9B85_13030 [Heliorestis acidaminivorans]|uniref:Uncharacterized protein n=1 Tax=Heliorestis acidaminivorans TaxID=553427 RepID=A0A6I0ERI4_9FIRM|nr:hypothetical protein [Heliorestis acidaminivorans]KAB2951286.1 hypothetical protein F9B85_13030 [Heliorestis acidaminivorans]
MELKTKDFLMKALLNEQELVRDYQKFSQTTDDSDVAELFKEYATTDALRANRIKEILQDKYGVDEELKS